MEGSSLLDSYMYNSENLQAGRQMFKTSILNQKLWIYGLFKVLSFIHFEFIWSLEF
jgi:hypothetical protein